MRAVTAGIVALLGCVQSTRAHIFFECPSARTCFYGGSGPETDGDGAWRREPCDREAVPPSSTVEQGSNMTLRIHEFVPHPGYFEIRLATIPVSPGDPEPDWIVLNGFIDQVAPLGQTGFHNFEVEIPGNVTCDHCTIQTRQWADDFQWYYYACTDIEVVPSGALAGGADDNTCWNTTASAAFETGPSRIRIKILQTIVIGSFVLICVLLVALWAGRVWLAVRRARSQSLDVEVAKDPAPESCRTQFFAESKRSTHRRLLLLSISFTLVGSVALGVTISGLKSCKF